MVVRAFDGSHRDMRGEIDLPIHIGPHTCQIAFQVMDINPTYSCLLGQPWIHSVGVVPSTLHQKLKFVVEGQLVIVSGEEDILVSCLSSTPYVEAVEESLEMSFQALEIVNNAYVESPPIQPRLFGASLMVTRVMLKDGYQPRMGLGQNSDGMTSLLKFAKNRGRFGLGYKHTNADKRRISLERKEISLAHLQGWGPQVERVPICHINESFISVGWMHEDQVAVLDEETNQDQPNWVQSCSPSFELKNWQIMERLGIFVSNPM